MKVVFHLDLDEEKVLRIALTNMENLRADGVEAETGYDVRGRMAVQPRSRVLGYG